MLHHNITVAYVQSWKCLCMAMLYCDVLVNEEEKENGSCTMSDQV